MKTRDAIAAGIVHLSQNRLRAGLSILGISIGIASVLCMMAIGDGAKKIITDDLKKFGGPNRILFDTHTSIWKRGRLVRRTTERYTFEDISAIEAECPSVLFVLPTAADRYRRSTVISQRGGQTRTYVEGVTPDYAQGMHWEVQHGRFFSENDIETGVQVCILGAEAAMDLFGEAFAIGEEVKIKFSWRQPAVRCRVVGIMAPKGRSLHNYYSLDDIVCVPLTTHQQRLSGEHYVLRFTVFFQKGADVYSVIDSVKDVLRKRHRGKDDFIGYRLPNRSIRQLEHIQRVIGISLGSIAGFSLFVGGIGIMNICFVSVGEKTREIGLRKSIGAKRIEIFWQFLTESVCLCFCGGVFGIVGGWLAAHGMARLAVHIVPIVPKWPVVLSGHWILISVIFSIFMGVGFGVYPAMRAARMPPIDALRAEN